MHKVVDELKSLAALYKQAAIDARKKGNDSRADTLEKRARVLDDAVIELKRLYRLTTALPKDMGDIFDLPSELVQELSITKGDSLEDKLITVINSYGGTANLDQILVGLYKKYGIIQKRRYIQNKLYRMAKAGMVHSIKGKKGIYTTDSSKITEDSDVLPISSDEYDAGDDDLEDESSSARVHEGREGDESGEFVVDEESLDALGWQNDEERNH